MVLLGVILGLLGWGRLADIFSGLTVFFSIYEGVQPINLMEGLEILYAFEWEFSLGWRKVICESDSQVMTNFLKDEKLSDVHWQLVRLVQQIL